MSIWNIDWFKIIISKIDSCWKKVGSIDSQTLINTKISIIPLKINHQNPQIFTTLLNWDYKKISNKKENILRVSKSLITWSQSSTSWKIKYNLLFFLTLIINTSTNQSIYKFIDTKICSGYSVKWINWTTIIEKRLICWFI